MHDAEKDIRLPARFNLKKLVEFAILSVVDLFATKRRVTVAPGTLLIIRPDALGDYIIFRNFLKEIKQSNRFARFRITLLGNVLWRELSETMDAESVDQFIWMDRKRLHSDIFYRFRFLRELTSLGYEMVVYPVHSREFFLGDFLVHAVTATEKITTSGDLNNLYRWEKYIADRWYTSLLQTSNDLMFEFLRDREIVERLTEESSKVISMTLSVPDVSLCYPLPVRYAVIVPGSGFPARRWPSTQFGAVAYYLNSKYGISSVVTGTSGDNHLAYDVINAASGSCADLTGKLSLLELVKVIAGADLLISNDTGPVHIGAAVGTPFVCISDGHHLGRFHPYPAEMKIKGLYAYPEEVSAMAGNAEATLQYGRGAFADITTITVEAVEILADSLLGD